MTDNEDYVPGITDAENLSVPGDSASVPFGGSDAEEYEIDLGILPKKQASEIEKDVFRQIPPGEHTVIVAAVEFAGAKFGASKEEMRHPVTTKVYVVRPNNTVSPATIFCRRVQVTFCLPGDPNCQVRDWFLLPPEAEEDKEAYERGFYGTYAMDAAQKFASGESKKGQGQEANRLVHFLGRLGFSQDANGNFPPEAGKLKNWVYYPGSSAHRLVKLVVKVSKPKREGDTIYHNVSMCSYVYVPPPDGIVTPPPAPHVVADPEAIKDRRPPTKPGKRTVQV